MGEINKKTTVSLAVVCLIIAAAIAWGSLTTMVTMMKADLNEMQEQMITFDDKLDQILIRKSLSLE